MNPLPRLLSACLLLIPVWAGRTQDLMLGPLVQEFDLTLVDGQGMEAAGPFYSRQDTADQQTWGVHPLFSRTEYDADATEFDFLYPVLTFDRFGQESRWQVFQLLNFSSGRTQGGREVTRSTFFPFYFNQRSEDGRDDYTAFFPFYGKLRNRIFRNEIQFVAWPLYVSTRKGARSVPIEPTPDQPEGGLRLEGGFTTRNYLLPLVHVREGEDLQGWQVWPLAGYEAKQAGTRTNVWGDIELSAGYRKTMALWPLFMNERRQIGTENPEHEQAILPFFTRLHSPQRDSFTAPWPLGLTLTDDRAKGYREWGFPWPLVVFARGPGKTADRVWPLFSRVQIKGQRGSFLLWPLYKVSTYDSPPLWRQRHRVLFYLYSDVVERNTETGQSSARTDLWPLFTARQDKDGSRRLQLLAPLEPILPSNKGIERNWSPVWSIWRSEQNPKAGKSSTSFLWNLYRHDRTPASKKCSLVFGLFQYQSTPDGKRWRLFGVPFGCRPAEAARPKS